MISIILENSNPRILLIHSGATGRYWACVDKILHEILDHKDIPMYYRNKAEDFNTWFRVVRFEVAQKNILTKCNVVSSGQELGSASRYSMSPYIKIYAPDTDD